uniref:Uncharacterized protein n=1 Tax=Arundo donax TaxID=35708 RepID=A0A0A9FSJ7_ARUDO
MVSKHCNHSRRPQSLYISSSHHVPQLFSVVTFPQKSTTSNTFPPPPFQQNNVASIKTSPT